MGHYDDWYAAVEEEELLRQWGPKVNAQLDLSERNVRLLSARAARAESKVRDYEDVLRDFKRILQ